MITPMERLTLVCPRSLLEHLLEVLMDFGKVQLDLAPLADHIPAGDVLLDLRARTVALLEALNVREGEYDGALAARLSDRLAVDDRADLQAGIDQLTELYRRHRRGEDDLRARKAALKDLLHFPGSIVLPQGLEGSLWWVPRQGLSGFTDELKTLEGVQWHLLEAYRPDASALIVFSPPGARRVLEDRVRAFGVFPWSLPAALEGENLINLLADLPGRISETEKALEVRQALQERMARGWGPRLRAFDAALRRHLLLLRGKGSARAAGLAVVLQGWIACENLPVLESVLEHLFGGKVWFLHRPPRKEEAPPVDMRHSKVAEPFSLFMKMVRKPAYGASDPTGWIALCFPFFAGCIVGDAGYSVLMLFLLQFLKKKFVSPVGRYVATILRSVALWGVFWGVLFGEYFGDLAARLFGVHALWVDRHHAAIPVLALGLVFGFVHVTAGLAIGAGQAFKRGHGRHGLEKIGNILVILGAALAGLAGAKISPHGLLWVGMACSGFGVALMALGGLGGVMESLSSLGSVLSYVRIGAIGLSSAILAMTAGKFLDTFGLGFAGVFSFLVLHGLNFCLAFAESSLHAARLHYVEFMGKFYHDGGQPFVPFAFEEERQWKKV